MFRKYAEVIILIKWPLLLGLIIVTLLSGLSACLLRIDPTVESLFIKDSPEYEYYRAYRDRYGSDQVVAVAMSATDIFTIKNLQTLENLTKALEEFPQVERVLSLSTVMNIEHKFFGVKVVPALEGALDGEKTLVEVKEQVLNNELFLNNLVSLDGKSANIIVRLKPDFNESGDFVKELRDLLDMKSSRDVKFYVAGSPIEQYDFVRLIRKDQYTFVPMITLFLILMTLLIYRSFSCVVLSMSIVFVTLAWTFGLISFLGQQLNLVTSLLAPVIMIVTVVNAIHFMNLFFEIRGNHGSLRWSVILTIEQLGLPCFLTHLTTIIGFLSLVANPVPAIRSFGLFAAAGTAFSFCVSMLLVPLILPLLPYRISKSGGDEAHFFNRVLIGFLERLEYRWKWVILLGVVGAIVFSVIGIRRLDVDTSLVKQMKPDSPLAIATRFIDDNLTGVYSLGFILRVKDKDRTIVDPELLQQIDDFKTYLESMNAISKVNSITTLLKKINEAREDDPDFYQIPENQKLVQKYFDAMIEDENPELWFLISRDLKEVRLEARMRSVGTKEGAMVEEKAMEYMQSRLKENFDCNITGNVVLLGKMAKELVFFQMRSFAFAFVPILILITLIFRSITLGILAAIPNLLPIVAVYGLMGFLGIELSTATAMISSIVLGLVVDSSIHFLHRFKHEFRRREYYLQALHHTYRNVGQALCVSTLILIVGFCTSIFAGFRPTVQFGLLTSLTIFIALVCTLLILPVCIVQLRPFGRQKAFQ